MKRILPLLLIIPVILLLFFPHVAMAQTQEVNENLVSIHGEWYAGINMESARSFRGLIYWLTYADDYAEYIVDECDQIRGERGKQSVEDEISAHAWGIFLHRTDTTAGITAGENIPWYYRLAD